MKLREELITPQEAAFLLATQIENQRKLRPTHVAFLADQMSRGVYRFTSETIKIGPDGRMFDGQNRCSAVVRCGIPQRFMVSRGEDPKNFEVIDKGKVRTDADSIRMNPNAVALIKRYNKHALGFSGPVRKLAPDQILALYSAHKEAFDFAVRAKSYDRSLSNVSIWTAIVEYYEKDQVKAIEFANALRLPVPNIKQAALLRDTLLREKKSTGDCPHLYYKTVFCANAHLHNRDIQRVIQGDWTS